MSSVIYLCVYFRPRENCTREEMRQGLCVCVCVNVFVYLCLLPAVMFLSSVCLR